MDKGGNHRRGASSVSNLRQQQAVPHREKQVPLKDTSDDWVRRFESLRDRAIRAEDVREIYAPDLLAPFLEVIRSGETDGQITVAAITSVEQFLRFGLFDDHTPGIAEAVRDVARAATRCRFLSAPPPATPTASYLGDEAVLYRILKLACSITTDSLANRHIDDASVCEVMETVLSMCCQVRLGEVLRRSAERAVTDMVRAVFVRLRELESEEDFGVDGNVSTVDPNESASHPTTPAVGAMHVSSIPSGVTEGHVEVDESTQTNPEDVSLPLLGNQSIEVNDGDSASMGEDSAHHQREASTDSTVLISREEANATPSKKESLRDAAASQHRRRPSGILVTADDGPAPPFGLPAIRELLRVLVALVDPRDRQYSDAVRLVALAALRAALEISGASIDRFASLSLLTCQDLCRHLFQTLATENITLLQATLQTTELILALLPTHTRFQRELFIQSIMSRLSIASNNADGSAAHPSPQASKTVTIRPEAREMLVDCMVRCVVDESAASEIWVNYDCEVGAEDILEKAVRLLCQFVTPEAVRIAPGASRKALDGIMRLLTRLAERAGVDPKIVSHWRPARRKHDPTLEPPEVYIEKKRYKRVLQEAAAKFNVSPKQGIAFMEEQNLIPKNDGSDDDGYSLALAKFLKSTPWLNKRLLGEHLAKKANLPLLQIYVKLFNFNSKRIDEALRIYLEGFRLPGEAQQIERIMEVFSNAYFATGPAEVATRDATFVLCFSIIMLNTDLHNPQVKRRMTMEDYMKNLRSVNDGKNFAPEYLVAIYEAIRDHEIVMPEERSGTDLGFDFHWREMMHKASIYGHGRICDSVLFDRDIFATIAQPMTDTFLNVYEMAQDDMALETSFSALLNCATLAARHRLSDVLDGIVQTLTRLTGLLGHGFGVREHRVIELPNGESVAVSRLAVRFGQNYKGQVATILLFKVIRQNAAYLDASWKSASRVLDILKTLFCHALLPSALMSIWDPVKNENEALPLRIKVPQPEQSNRDSWFSYLMPSYSESVWEPTEGEREYSRRTCRCIASCNIGEVFYEGLFGQDRAALKTVLRTITALGDHELPNDYPRRGKDEFPPYNALNTLMIELAVKVALQNSSLIELIWSQLSEFLLSFIVRSKEYHPFVVQRAIVSLVQIALDLPEQIPEKSQAIQSLTTVQSLSPLYLEAVAAATAAGIRQIVMLQPEYAFSDPHGSAFQSTLLTLSEHSLIADTCFDIAKLIASDADRSDKAFARAIRILGSFATAAECAPEAVQSQTLRSAYIQRGCEAVDLLYGLHKKIPVLIESSNRTSLQAWPLYWFPLVSCISKLCSNPAREIRLASLGTLHKILLLSDLSDASLGHSQPFDRIIFPLMEEFLRPEVRAADPNGVDDMRVRVVALLCNYLLQQLPNLLEWDGLVLLWSRALELLGSYVRSGHQVLIEATTESMKNVILVMSASGAFPDIQDLSNDVNLVGTQRGALWEATWRQVDTFLPGLKHELFPAPHPSAAPTSEISSDQAETVPESATV